MNQKRLAMLFALLVIGYFALLAVSMIVSVVRDRVSAGRPVRRCDGCGYDLRASRRVCPECGRSVAAMRGGIGWLDRADRLLALMLVAVLVATAGCAILVGIASQT